MIPIFVAFIQCTYAKMLKRNIFVNLHFIRAITFLYFLLDDYFILTCCARELVRHKHYNHITTYFCPKRGKWVKPSQKLSTINIFPSNLFQYPKYSKNTLLLLACAMHNTMNKLYSLCHFSYLFVCLVCIKVMFLKHCSKTNHDNNGVFGSSIFYIIITSLSH